MLTAPARPPATDFASALGMNVAGVLPLEGSTALLWLHGMHFGVRMEW